MAEKKTITIPLDQEDYNTVRKAANMERLKMASYARQILMNKIISQKEPAVTSLKTSQEENTSHESIKV